MGVNIRRHRSIGRPGNGTVFLVVLGAVALGTVLAVWTGRPGVVPPVFGTAGGVAVISLSLMALVAAAFLRPRAKGTRRAVGAATLLLAAASELLALGHLASGRGAPDTGLGWVLSAGVVAMATLGVRALGGGPG